MTALANRPTHRVNIICTLTDFELTLDMNMTNETDARKAVHGVTDCIVSRAGVFLVQGDEMNAVNLSDAKYSKRVNLSHVDITEDAFTFEEKHAVFFAELCSVFGQKDIFHFDFSAYTVKRF